MCASCRGVSAASASAVRREATDLEQALHQKFDDRRLNLVNLRREHFYVTPREVEQALLELRGSLLTFVEEPEALEWRQSETLRKRGKA